MALIEKKTSTKAAHPL